MSKYFFFFAILVIFSSLLSTKWKEDLIEFSAGRSVEIIRDDKNKGIFHSYLPLHVNKFLSLLCIPGQI